mgnify:FL=1|tara:strand:- start:155 stop:1951 length:1797 start_codon:yes stop_codon:yes gene_type:complete
MAENTKIIISAVDKTRKGFSSVTSGLKKVSGAVFNLKTALLGTVGAAGFGMLIKSSLQATDQLAKTASKIGTTTEALSQLRFAADLTGVATQTMDMALQRFTRRAAEAAKGTGEAKNAIRELGINAQELVRLPLDQRMLVLADAFSNVENESDKLRLAFKLFDSEGAALVNTLSLGRDELEKLFGEARSLGIVMSSDAAKGVENANDALTRLGSLFRGVRDQLVAALAPAISAFVDFIKNNLQTAIQDAGGSVTEFGKTLAVSFIEGAKTSVSAAESIANAVIGAFNAMTKAKTTFDSLLGNETFDTIQRDIDKINELIGTSKLNPDRVRFFGDKGIVEYFNDQELLAFKNELLATQKELVEAGKGTSLIDDVNFSAVIEGLTAAQEAAKGLQNTFDELEKKTDVDLPNSFQQFLSTMEALRPQAKDVTESLAEIANKAIDGLGKAFTDAITGAKKFSDAIRSMAKSVIDSLIQMLIQKFIVDRAFGAITNFFNPSSTDGATPKALGGQVQANKPYMVGERGTELFVPHSSGTIIPNNKLSGSGGFTINQTINISTGVQSTVRSELVQLLPQIAAVTRSSVADARLRGGSFSKAMVGA